jgi:hypothetical protein
MKSFSKLLVESKKTYTFKVGLAGDLPEGFEEKMKTALAKFSLANISAGKKTPIQERPLDFPQLQNIEVTYYEVELNYPTTVQVLQEYLGQSCSIDQAYIIVRNINERQEEYQETKIDKVYEPLLTKEELEGTSAQDSVADNRIMELLKELETARKERQHDPAAAAPKGSSKDIDSSDNTKSAVGS